MNHLTYKPLLSWREILDEIERGKGVWDDFIPLVLARVG
jgi:hypothetical protein